MKLGKEKKHNPILCYTYFLKLLIIDVKNLLVITDDIALPFGKIRIRKKGSHGGHNGLRNIEALLGNAQYPRLRFGVGDDFPKGAQVHYVLADFSSEEQTELDEKLLPKMADAILTFAGRGIDAAMNDFNG